MIRESGAPRDGSSPVIARTSELTDLRSWDAASTCERFAAANEVASREPEFKLERLGTFSCGGQAHEVAIYSHAKTGLEFVLVPGGTFLFGSPIDEPGRSADETQRTATVAPFLIARTPCTQAAYERIVGENPSNSRGPTLPVERVTWTEAVAFCAAVDLVLPSEVEWEYACRAGTTTTYSFGDDVSELADYAWYGSKPKDPGAGTHPVGQKKANAFGLYEMHGNVWQWCDDTCGSLPNGRPLRVTAQEDLPRVLRGGDWTCAPRYLRSAHRARMMPESEHLGSGFRPAKRVAQAGRVRQ
jgi:formylglycine-generating enzyme required for sulfatase activity